MKFRAALSAVCILISYGLALTPHFNPRDGVRQAHSSHSEPRPSSAFLVDTSITYVNPAEDRSAPAVAFDGTNYLAVWEDFRNSEWNIIGARVTQAGVLLDTGGFLISENSDQHDPAVAFDGTVFLVVWSEIRDTVRDIRGARVTPAGTVLDPAGIEISTAPGGQFYPAVTYDGTNFVVVWSYTQGGIHGIHGARVSSAGAVLDTAAIVISTHTDDSPSAVASDGTGSLVVWQFSGSVICGVRLAPGGTVLDSAAITISDGSQGRAYPAATYDGTDYVVVWQDSRSSLWDIYGARVSKQGVVLDTSGIAVTAVGNQTYPSVTFDGENNLVTWSDKRNGADIYGARLSPQGTVLDTSAIQICGAPNRHDDPVIAAGPENCLVVWWDQRHEYTTISGARVDHNCTVLDPEGIPLSLAANFEEHPAAAFDGENFLVVWQSYNGNDWDILGIRVAPTGKILDPVPIPICTLATDQSAPKVAFDGANYLVVWEDCRSNSYGSIYGTRLTPGGVVLDVGGFPIGGSAPAQDGFEPAVAFGGGYYLVTWAGDAGTDNIYCTRVATDGRVLETQLLGYYPFSGSLEPALDYNGDNFLVVWERWPLSYPVDIYGGRVTPAGQVLDGYGFEISGAAGDQRTPVVVKGKPASLVVWEDARRGESDIYGARVTADGVVLDVSGIPICTAARTQMAPAATPDDSNFFVAWSDDRSRDWDIYAARVSSQGSVVDSVALVAQQYGQVNPAFGRGTAGLSLMVYQSLAPTILGRSADAPRIWGFLLNTPFGVTGDVAKATSFASHATVVRGILFLPRDMTELPGNSDRVPRPVLLDISGRKVLDLRSGANDVSRLSPGVYFVREAQAKAVRKVVLTR
ncbi:MAG TPA: hypothetical protein VMH22_10135 [bacterium]|nr:hypothetical protein [bacterium]